MLREVFDLRRRKPTSGGPDRVIEQLDNVEHRLQKWINASPKNADWFRRDPIGAMQAAGLNIEDDIMMELELITQGIARKLK